MNASNDRAGKSPKPRRVFGSLRFRAIVLVLLTIFPLLGWTIYSYLDQRRSAVAEVQRDAMVTAQNVAKIQETLFRDTSQLFQTLAQLPQVLKQDAAACKLLFTRVIENHENFVVLMGVYPNGEVFASAPPSPRHINVADRSWFQGVMQTRDLIIGEPQLGRITGRYSLPLAFPVQDPSGRVTAVLATGLDLHWLGRFIMQPGLPRDSTLLMIDRNREVMFRYPDPEKFIGHQLSESFLGKTMFSKDEGAAQDIGLDQVPRLFGFTHLSPPFQDFHVAVGIPRAAAFADIDRELIRSLIILSLVAFLVMAVAWFGSGFFIKPITGLEQVTRQLAAGDLTVRTGPPYRSGELGLLARDFDRMADAIQERDSQLKQAAAELQQRLLELNAAYQEMESFSYTVAHDLRAPLRAIGGFSRILQEESGDNLNAEAVRCLHIIQRDIKKMGDLIDDLLNLSRLGRREMRLVDFEMEDLARAVFARLREQEPERHLQVSFDSLPAIRGDQEMLRQVWENLLVNALKFTRSRPETVIEISGEVRDGENFYCIRDNGVGFEIEYAAKLFEVFQRLHPEDEYEGTGMGLAIVQRIIQRHGGRVWGEGKVGEGAKFCFTLPREESGAETEVPGEGGLES